jgi:hypothetical protein
MASTYTTTLALQLMATGENAGTWGSITNTNLTVVQQAIVGYQDVSIAGGAQTTALVVTQNALSNAKNAVLKLSGTITGNQIVTVPNGITKTWIVSNGTTGAFTVTFKYASTGTGITWSTTDKAIKILYADGTDIRTVDLSTLSGTVGAAKITTSTITTTQLAAGAVLGNNIATSTITASKLAANSVVANNIVASTITQSKLAANSVGSNQLINTSVTAGSYTTASITVDADGRITAASSGSAGTPSPTIALNATGPASGTYTASPGTTQVWAFLGGGGGGGCGEGYNFIGGDGGSGGFGLFKKVVTLPYSVPYVLGAGGSGQNGESPAPSGSASSLNTNDAVANGGGGGNRSQGQQGSPGSTTPTNRIYDMGSPTPALSMTINKVYYGNATGPGVVNSSYSDVYQAVQGLGNTVAQIVNDSGSSAGGSRGNSFQAGFSGGAGRITIFEKK